jgi:metal-responsive CopG/Arc/MetJ family transcriptional regulator
MQKRNMQHMHMYMPKEMIAELQAVAESKSIERSSLIRMWLAERLNQEKNRNISSI